MLLQFGDKGDNVKYLQYGLHILCYSSNGFDGKFGDGTLTAVKKFQSKYGLVSDGIVGDVTWNTLKNEITTIQSQLNKKGFNVGTVDGVAGAATYNSVISFQSKNGLTADGQVGPATWDVLFDTISGGNSYSRILKLTSPLMYGEDIRAVQNKLNSLGYVAGTADGYYGNMTRNAVINFQSKKGLAADGDVGPTTWSALFNTSTSGGSGYSRILKLTSPLMYGEDIKAVQNRLNSLGYNAGTADGYYGNGTRTAVINFQTAKGLDADGDVGPTTWNALFNTSNSGGSGYSRILKLTSPLMYGEDIRAVQNKLNSLGYNAGTADGYYGNDTKNAVINLQNTFGITADGIVGPTTWKYLFETNASVSNILKVAGNIGLFENAEFTFTELNSKTPEVRLSLSPAIYVQGELSLTGSLSGSMTNNYINLSLSPDTITTNIINNLSTINIEHDIDPKTLKASISQLTQTQNINDNISYSITLNDFGALEITLEAVIPANTDINFGGINLNLGVNLYQRLIVTIKPNRLPPPSNNGVISEIAIPLYKPESEILPNDVVIKNMKYVNYISLIAVALLTGMKVISTTLASTASGPLSILLALVFFILR